MAGRALTIDITTRDQQTLAALKRVQKELSAVDKAVDKTAKESDKLGKSADDYAAKLSNAREVAGGIVLGGTVAVLGASTKAAGELAEAQAKTNAVFGESAGIINDFAEGATEALALSKREALESASTFGNLFTQMDISATKSAEMSKSMITLAGNFAAFHNANPVDVIEAQTAAFRGEYDALQKFVPTINAAAVEQQALAETGKSSARELTAQEKALATYSLMLAGAGKASGAAAREADGLAMSSKRAKAELENSAASIGTSLVPAAATAAKGIAGLASAFGALPAPMQTGVVGIGGLVVGLGLLGPKVAEGVGLLRSGVGAVRAYGSETATTAQKMTGAGVAAGALAGALVAGAAAWNQWGAAGRGAANQWADQFDAANGRTVAGLRQTAAETRAWGDAIKEAGGSFAGLPDPGDLFDIDADRETAEAKKAAEGRAKAYEDAADRIEEAAKRSGMSVADAEKALAATGVDPTIMSVDKLTGALEDYQSSGAGAAEASAALARDLAAEEAAADAARSAVDGLRSAEEGVASARAGVSDAQDRVADAERGVTEARKGVADAARGVADAEKGLADARQGAVEAAEDLADAQRDLQFGTKELEDAHEGVVDAEKDLASAQRDSKAAQEDLTEARERAAEVLEDLATSARSAVLDEKEAVLDLRDAREALAAGPDIDEAKPGESAEAAVERERRNAEARKEWAEERERLQIRVERAEMRLAEAQERNGDAAEELAAAQARGIEQSEEVTAAKDAIAAAADAERTAEEALAEAKARVVEVQEALAQRVVEAQQRVVEANDRVAEAGLRVRDAQDQVAAAQQRVVDQQGAVVEARAAVEEAERKVTDALVAQAIAQAELDAALANSKGALDGQIVKLLELAGQMEPGSPVRQRLLEMAEQLNSLTARPWTIELQTRLQAVDAINRAMELALSGTDEANRGGRAIGGRVAAGRVYPVGENGPEILRLDPGESGRVFTPEQWAVDQRKQEAMAERDRRGQAKAAAGPRTLNVTINEAATPWATVDLIGSEFDRLMKVGVVH